MVSKLFSSIALSLFSGNTQKAQGDTDTARNACTEQKRKIPSALVEVRSNGIYLGVSSGSAYPEVKVSVEHLMILEILAHDPDVDSARIEFVDLMEESLAVTLDKLIPDVMRHENFTFVVQPGLIQCIGRQNGPAGDLSDESRRTRQVLRAVAAWFGEGAGQRNSFDSALALLDQHGFIAPPAGELNWGDLRRLVPVCARFGFSRGTPIDRYYLDKFIDKARPLVHGEVVEIGGRNSNRETYAFEHAKRYRGFDIFASPDNSLVGDAHDPKALPEAELDTLIAFNVLEHCPKPWLVIENMHRWLVPGGIALVMVPSAQRLHRMPEDYWRPLPAALAHLFSTWSECELHVYGNPVTTIAAFLGIAVEELNAAELDVFHPDYPVASCIIAKK